MPPIQSEDFKDVAASLTTPTPGEAVAADAPVPTDKYLTSADVEATKAADAKAKEALGVAPPAENAPIVAKDGITPDPAKEPAKEPPQDRWPEILENARKKERAAVEGEYAWAKELNRDDVEATRKWIALGNQNPLLALDQLVQGMIKVNPEHKGQIERYFKSILETAGPAAAAAAAASVATGAAPEDEMPQPDIPTDTSNGKPVVYSFERTQELLKWYGNKISKELRAEYRKDIEPILNEREEEAVNKQIDDYTDRSVSAISGLRGFEEYRAEIAAAYAAIPITDTARTEGEKLRDAYLQVISTKLPEQIQKETAKAQQEAVASVHRRAEAATVNPASSSASAPFDYKTASWQEALRHEFNTAALGR